MWLRFIDALRCPSCKHALVIAPFETTTMDVAQETLALARTRNVLDARFQEYVLSGLLLCPPCKAMFPIVDGLPILLCYTTPLHARFLHEHSREVEPYRSYRFLELQPESGELAVMNSFSKEWLDYDYDGVIWEMNYEDHERRFLREIGPALKDRSTRMFLEVGCGIGITTYLAHKNS
ncbi:MAG: hypothetical protein DMG78_33090, partial [Acidobacteria bacterium]